MSEKPSRKPSLRQRAEARLTERELNIRDLSETEIRDLVHELSVHQVELEIQNEEMLAAQKETEPFRQHYYQLYHKAPVGYVALDRKGIIRQTNATFCDMVNRNEGTLINTPLDALISESDRPVFLSRFKAFFNKPEKKSLEVSMDVTAAEPVFFRLEGSRLQSGEGLYHVQADEDLVLVAVSDISEIKDVEQKIDFQAQLLNAVGQSVIATDLAGKIIYWNRAAKELYGWTKEEVLGRHLIDEAFPEARGSIFEEQYTLAIKEQKALSFETWFGVAPYDNWYKINVYPFDGGITVCFDVITPRKRTEERIQHLNAVLKAIRNVNQLITHETDPLKLIQKACKCLVETRGYHNAWIVLLDSEGQYVAAAQSGVGRDFQILRSRMKKGQFTRCGQKALANSHVICLESPAGECDDCPLAKKYTGRSGLVKQLVFQGRIYGLLTVSTPVAFATDREEQDLFREVADDIAYALNNMEVSKDRERARASLELSEKRFRALVDHATDAIFYHDPTGRILEVNQTAVNRLGYSREELVQLNAADIDDEKNAPLVRGRIEQLMKQGKLYFETRHKTKDGRLIPVEVTSRLVEFEGKTAVLSSARNISDRIEADRILRESEDRFRNIIEKSTNLFYSHTPDHQMTYASPQTRDFFDCEPEETMKKWTAFATDHPVNEAGFKLTEKAIKTGKAQPTYELELQGVKGRKIWVEVREAPVVENGETVAMVGSLTDITERKQAERELRIKDFAFASSISAIGLADMTGKVLDVNDSFVRLWKLKNKEEAIGRSIQEFADQRISVDRAVEEVMRSGATIGEGGLRTRDGDILDIEFAVSMVRDENDEPVCLMASFIDITERKRAEEAVRKSHEKYVRLFESMIDGFAIHQMIYDDAHRPVDYRFLDVNPAFERLTGLKKEDIAGKTVKQVLPDTEDVWIETYGRVVQSGEPYHFENYSRELEKYFEVTAYPAGPDQFVTVFVDITERRKAMEEIHLLTQNLQLATQSAEIGIWALDLVKNELTWDDRMFEIYGVSPETFGGAYETWQQGVHPEDLPKAHQEMQEAVNGKTEFHTRFRIVRPGGDIRHIEAHALVTTGEQGDPQKMIGVNRDITDQVHKNLALKNSEVRFRNILESVQLVGITLDIDGRLIFANDFFLSLTGWKREEIMGVDWFDTFLPPKVKKSVQKEVFFKAMQEKQFPLRYENEIVTRQGERRTVVWSNILDYDIDGNLTGSTSIGEDITQRKEYEAALLREKERAQRYLDIAGVMFIAINARGDITLANKKASEILECSECDIIGQNWFDSFLLADNMDEVKKIFYEIIAGHVAPFEYMENRVQTKTGKQKLIAWHNTVLRNEKGVIVGTLSSGEDITDRKIAEKNLKEKMEELSRFNKLMVGRELRMIELKEEVNTLSEQLELPQKYKLSEH